MSTTLIDATQTGSFHQHLILRNGGGERERERDTMPRPDGLSDARLSQALPE